MSLAPNLDFVTLVGRAAERDIAMVFRSYALYPHMDVFHNIGYGLKVRRARARSPPRWN